MFTSKQDGPLQSPWLLFQLPTREENRTKISYAAVSFGGVQVVLAANSLPAINDITCAELRTLISSAAALDPVINVRNFHGSSIYGFDHLCSIYTVLLSPGRHRPSELHDWLPIIFANQLLTHVPARIQTARP